MIKFILTTFIILLSFSIQDGVELWPGVMSRDLKSEYIVRVITIEGYDYMQYILSKDDYVNGVKFRSTNFYERDQVALRDIQIKNVLEYLTTIFGECQLNRLKFYRLGLPFIPKGGTFSALGWITSNKIILVNVIGRDKDNKIEIEIYDRLMIETGK